VRIFSISFHGVAPIVLPGELFSGGSLLPLPTDEQPNQHLRNGLKLLDRISQIFDISGQLLILCRFAVNRRRLAPVGWELSVVARRRGAIRVP
jgi:hypothetical protein